METCTECKKSVRLVHFPRHQRACKGLICDKCCTKFTCTRNRNRHNCLIMWRRHKASLNKLNSQTRQLATIKQTLFKRLHQAHRNNIKLLRQYKQQKSSATYWRRKYQQLKQFVQIDKRHPNRLNPYFKWTPHNPVQLRFLTSLLRIHFNFILTYPWNLLLLR